MYLNCHSYFSLRYGTLSVERLVEEAAAHGVRVLALNDILDFVKECRRHQIKPLAGVEFRNDQFPLYVGIARNNEGFYEFNGLEEKMGNAIVEERNCFGQHRSLDDFVARVSVK